MHSLKLFALACALLASTASHGQVTRPDGQIGFDDRYKIAVQLLRPDGTVIALKGSQELYILSAANTDHGVAYDANPPPPLVAGNNYILKVFVTDPSGKVTDYSGSPRLRYETFGCFTASSLGTFAATPMTGTTCLTPAYPELWVQLTDVSGNVIHINAFMFKIIPS